MADPALPPALCALRDRPAEGALFLDYDGTLAPIVPDPAGARPAAGVPGLLAHLGARLGLVAVVSGRPARYLLDVLGRPAGVHLAGLYGMETVGTDGVVRHDQAAETWRPVVARATATAAEGAPPGAEVEAKGLSVTLHWRRNPAAEGWAQALAAELSGTLGLSAQPGRMSLELRPPVEADKGTVVTRLGAGHRAAAGFGDDYGDLPAFAALDALGRAGVLVAKVAVVDPESPPAVAAAADLVVEGPAGAVALLRRLAGEAPDGRRS